jgi:hypothetical protein
MTATKMPHPNHENHLCYLENIGYLQEFPEAFKQLVRNGKYMCKVCGRVAADKGSLCVPDRL